MQLKLISLTIPSFVILSLPPLQHHTTPYRPDPKNIYTLQQGRRAFKRKPSFKPLLVTTKFSFKRMRGNIALRSAFSRRPGAYLEGAKWAPPP